MLLDNCEHVVVTCAELAATLLGACPYVRILATSREALGVGGEVVWRVPSLTLPPPDIEPRAELVSRYEAVLLFIRQARLARPDFTLTAANVAAVARVCRRLDGIPLALELVAARLSVLTIEGLAARLDDRFRILVGGSRTELPRHQTLRATMDWSYALLSAPERVLLRRLAVFVGGWPLEAAEAVCATPADRAMAAMAAHKARLTTDELVAGGAAPARVAEVDVAAKVLPSDDAAPTEGRTAEAILDLLARLAGISRWCWRRRRLARRCVTVCWRRYGTMPRNPWRSRARPKRCGIAT